MKTAEQRQVALSSILSNIEDVVSVNLIDDTTKQALSELDGLELKLGDVVLGVIDLDTAELKHTKKNLPFINLVDSGMFPVKFGRLGQFDLMKRVSINVNPVNRTAKV